MVGIIQTDGDEMSGGGERRTNAKVAVECGQGGKIRLSGLFNRTAGDRRRRDIGKD